METEAPVVAGGFLRRAAWIPSGTLALFGCTIFVGSALVFLVEPMVGKMLLPLFGGTPAVWAVSLVFFQAVLLAGYAFAHLSIRLVSVRRQSFVQLGLLLVPLALLPIAVKHERAVLELRPDARAARHARRQCRPALVRRLHREPGAATLVLREWRRSIARPLFPLRRVERRKLPGPACLSDAARTATDAHAAVARLDERVRGLRGPDCAAVRCGCSQRRREAAAVSVPRLPVVSLTWRRRLRWIALAALPSSLMLGTTELHHDGHRLVPSALGSAARRLSHQLRRSRSRGGRSCRSRPSAGRSPSRARSSLRRSSVSCSRSGPWSTIHIVNLFLVSLLVHRRLALERPSTQQLTEYYLLLSVGGVCGGILTALVAPVVFTTILEYPIAIVLALVLRPHLAQPGARYFRGRPELVRAPRSARGWSSR